MYPNNSVGGWRCNVKVRARQNPPNRVYYHRADGGYVKRRRHQLAARRAAIIDALEKLEQEAVTLESEQRQP